MNHRMESGWKKRLRGTLHVLVLLLSLFLVAGISIDTFRDVPPAGRHSFLRLQSGICLFFLSVFVLELCLAARKLRYLATHWLFLLVSIPYLDIISCFHPELPAEAAYLLRFVPLVRGGYALAIVVGWFASGKASGLFASYLAMLLATVYFSSLMFFVLERGANPMVKDYGSALWWAFMDVTTVGSNIYAVTAVGKVFSVALAALGMMMFPIFTVYITSVVQKANSQQADGKKP